MADWTFILAASVHIIRNALTLCVTSGGVQLHCAVRGKPSGLRTSWGGLEGGERNLNLRAAKPCRDVSDKSRSCAGKTKASCEARRFFFLNCVQHLIFKKEPMFELFNLYIKRHPKEFCRV